MEEKNGRTVTTVSRAETSARPKHATRDETKTRDKTKLGHYSSFRKLADSAVRLGGATAES
jgi:hypothetical protein